MNEELRGNSGCKIESRGGMVFKYSPNPGYNQRLLASHKKMLTDKAVNYIVPDSAIIKESATEVLILKMSYAPGLPVAQWVMQEPMENVTRLFDRIIGAVTQNLIYQTLQRISKDKLRLKTVSAGIHLQKFEEVCPPFIDVPTGFCHGDYTLSNMKIDGQQLYVFDHLDSYIESPIMDLIKLGQDADFCWSLRYLNQPNTLDYCKKMVVLRQKINIAMGPWKEYYKILQYINLARIIPYMKSDYDRQMIHAKMEQIL